MKIGLITHYMPPHSGGIEQVAEMLLTGYRDRGLQVRWLASRDPRDAPAREGDRIRVPCWNGLERRAQLPLPLWGPAAWFQVARLARWADVLHVHDCLYPGSVLAILCRRSLGTPVLLSQHVGLRDFGAPALNFLASAAYRTLGRWVLGSSSQIVTVTPAAEEYVSASFGQSSSSASVIRNGIDTERFRPATAAERRAARADLALPADPPVALFVGRLVEQKGIPLLVEVVRRLPSVHFLVIGDGPLRSVLPAAPNVTWRRRLESGCIHKAYQAADGLFLPAHGEGLPLVVQEAAACALPILVSEGERYAGPLSERGACITSPRTADAMAEQLRLMLSEKLPELGARARSYAEAEWSWCSMVTSYIALLEELKASR